jgi:hypothetical protein
MAGMLKRLHPATKHSTTMTKPLRSLMGTTSLTTVDEVGTPADAQSFRACD